MRLSVWYTRAVTIVSLFYRIMLQTYWSLECLFMWNKLSCDVILHYVTVEMLYLDNHSQCYLQSVGNNSLLNRNNV